MTKRVHPLLAMLLSDRLGANVLPPPTASTPANPEVERIRKEVRQSLSAAAGKK